MPKVKLRQDNIRSLEYQGSAAGNAQCVYWDTTLPGFGLRKFPNGRASYVCSYRVQRRKRIVDLGRSDALTLDQARRKARLYLGTVADGRDPYSDMDEMRAAATVKKLAELYIERHAKPKKRTWKTDEALLNQLFLPRFGSHLAASITRADVASVHIEYGQRHPYAANRFLCVIRKMYNVGRQQGLVPEEMRNPGTEIERFPEQKRRRYVTPAEMPILAAAINADPNEFAGHAFWLLLLTGIRRNEILAAKWADIDWDNRTLFLGKTKNGEPVLTSLSRAATARLKLIPRIKDNPFIICGAMSGKPLRYLDAMWRRVRAETGFTDLRIHDLRRTVGSWLVRDGASLHLVGAVLNHKDQKTTAGYAYFQNEDRQKVLDRHGRKIEQIAKSHTRPSSNTPSSRNVATNEVPQLRRRVHLIKRKQLYDLVWAKPMTVVAKRLGVSDVGLAKACRRSDIPVPPRGYWAKIEAGGAFPQPTLPIQADPRTHVVRIRSCDPASRRAAGPTSTHETRSSQMSRPTESLSQQI